MTTTPYYWVAGASVLIWTPILYRFLTQWRRRSNPVSLALSASILLIMWWAVAGIWLITGAVDASIVVYTTAGVSILTAFCVHLAFYFSKKRFPDERKESN